MLVALALPLAVLLLSTVSSASINSLNRLPTDLAIGWLIPVAVVIALTVQGSYRPTRRSLRQTALTEVKDLAFGIGMGCLAALAFSVICHGIFGTRELAAAQVVTTMLVATALVAIARPSLRALHHIGNSTRVVIVDSGSLARQLTTYLNLLRTVEVVGLINPGPTPQPGQIGTLEDLPRLCELGHVDRVLLSPSVRAEPETVEILRHVQQRVRLEVVPVFHEVISWRSRLSDFYGLPIIEVAAPNLSSLDRLSKRTFDVFGAAIALLLLGPMFAACSLAIKLTSPGPVFFRQVRIGRHRQPFTIFKFRTMEEKHQEPAPSQAGDSPALTDQSARLVELRNKLAEQDRITRVGRLLRRTGFDELPQLINVLRGDMSLVGPRPFILEETEELDGWQARRFEVRPGITGLWQVSGRNDLATDDLRRLDYLYVASWSLWWDIKILWDTPRTMVKGFGAY